MSYPPSKMMAIGSLLVLIGCAGSYEPTDAGDLEKSFRSEFGFAPPESVSEIGMKTQRIGDTWSRWMRFRADESVFSRITDAGFEPFDAGSASGSVKVWHQRYSGSPPNAPAWWTPARDLGMVFYKSDFRNDFSASYHVVWRYEESGYIFSESGAWD